MFQRIIPTIGSFKKSDPTKFEDKLLTVLPEPFKAKDLAILQVNLGYRCNMACTHCHASAGPDRTEVMDQKTAEQVLTVLLNDRFETLDITGGAPELNPNFRMLVNEARNAGRHVIVRTNLTVLFTEGMSDIPEFLRDRQVDLIASLPYYIEDEVDRVRGKGTFKKSIQSLQLLNSIGYGMESSGLSLSLVYNPQGMSLAPDQCSLESLYKRELKKEFNVSFSHLYTFANMPIGRFRDSLVRTGSLAGYMAKLVNAFNPLTLDNLMCRHLLSVGWDGRLYDCDFNQVLGILTSENAPRHIAQFDYDALLNRKIAVDDHCYGCTAGHGSS